MKKAWVVFRYELRDLFFTRTFITLLLMPLVALLLGVGLYIGLQYRAAAEWARLNPQIAGSESSPFSDPALSDPASAPAAPLDNLDLDKWGQELEDLLTDDRPLGYVDEASLIRIYPDSYPYDNLLAFVDEAAARDALRSGKIRAYYTIPDDLLSTRLIFEYTIKSGISIMSQIDPRLSWLIRYNLADGDTRTLSILRKPILSLEEEDRSTLEERSNYDTDGPDHSLSFMLPALLGLGLWLILMIPASIMITALNREQETRTLEILLTSASSDDILLGKFVGLGLGGLLMVLAWLACALFYIEYFGHNILAGWEQISPGQIVWAVLYILGGAFFFSMLTALLGALMPNSKDANNFFAFLITPAGLPVVLFQPLLDQPNGPLAVALTLFPLTAPVTVILRLLAGGSLPLWQLILGLTLLLVCSLLVIKLAARLLRAQLLLTGWSLNRLRFLSRQEPVQKP